MVQTYRFPIKQIFYVCACVEVNEIYVYVYICMTKDYEGGTIGLSFWGLWHDDDIVVTEKLGSICAPM